MANHNLSEIKAIVFDLDDTLYPQVEYKRSGFKVVASWLADKRGVDSATVLQALEAILNQFGASYPYMFDRLVERLNMESELISELVSVFIHHDPLINCFEGVLPMLDRLKGTYRLGILTDGCLAVQQKKIGALNLKNQVDEILCSDLIGLEKPATELFEWFENRFQLLGEDLMYVGDNPQKDFYGANGRGWTTVMVKTGTPLSSSIPDGYEPQVEIPTVVDLASHLRYKTDGGDYLQVSNRRHGVYS